MKPFELLQVATVGEAVAGTGPGNKYIAGGTNLVDLMKYEVEHPDRLIDITRLPLRDVTDLHGGLRIGALVPNSDLAENALVKRRYPVLSEALLNGASPQLRNMATVGGNLLQRTRCYYFMDAAFPCNKRQPGSGCPAIAGINRIHAILGQSENCIATHPSDMAVALAALDTVVNVTGPEGDRQIPIAEFHRLPGDQPEIDTTLKLGELITSIEIAPLAMAQHSRYLKVRDRAQYAFALVSVAAMLDIRGGTVRGARIALGGVAHKPWRAHEAETALMGKPATATSFRGAAEAALMSAKGYKHNEFKIELAKRAIVRTLTMVAGGAA